MDERRDFDGSRPATFGERSGAADGVSPLIIQRLSLYLRSPRALEQQGIRRISSQQLADQFHLSSTQIRKDLAQFGEFGVRGVGYDVQALARHLSALLHLDCLHRIVIVGMGNVGTALAKYPPFNDAGFQVVAGFDSDAAKVGRSVGAVSIHPMASLEAVLDRTHSRMAVLAVPAPSAPEVYERLCAAGTTAILNFAPVNLPARPRVWVKSVDLRTLLEELAFFSAGTGLGRAPYPPGVE